MHDHPVLLKQQLCDIGRQICDQQYCTANQGNLSARLSNNLFLCTPTGQSLGHLTPADICTVDTQGRLAQPSPNNQRPTSELLVHLAIYHTRPDVTAVVHAHPLHATAFAITDTPVPQDIYPETQITLGPVPTAPYATPGSPALAHNIAAVITPQTNTVLMANHGSICFDTSLQAAYHKLQILDAYCRILLLAKPLGPPTGLTKSQLADLADLKQRLQDT